MALTFNALWKYGIRGNRLLGHQPDTAVISFINKSYAVGPWAYSGALLLVLVSAYVAFGVCVVPAVFFA